MAWGKAGSDTILTGNSSNTLTNSSLAREKTKQLLFRTIPVGGNNNSWLQYNGGGGSVYCQRHNDDYASAGDVDTTVNAAAHYVYASSLAVTRFWNGYICDITGEDKIMMYWLCDSSTAGNTAPLSREFVGKFSPTDLDDPVESIVVKNDSTGSFDTNSNLTTLGSDSTVTIQNGAIFEETDTNKHYLLDDGTWTEL
jgi:hypothetical protein